MSLRPFLKMHGLGNDFLLFDARTEPLSLTAQQVRALGDRRTGIGFDQMIVLEPSDTASVRVRFFNCDGSEAGACGNGSRAVAAHLGGQLSMETEGGLLSASATAGHAEVDMGAPRFDWAEVPLAYAMDTAHLPLAWDELTDPSAVSVGNPHIVFEVADAAAIPLESLGPRIETDPIFPQAINVGVAQVESPTAITLRVWERGAGLTRACGTGAVAAVAALQRRGRLSTAMPIRVAMPGGTLTVRRDASGHLHLAGPAVVAYRGEVDLEAYR
ncbi:diaminopimelate epimerase [Polymorphobacter sp.]|uniref:diaminopimelate epimerase n=1 Tax=Polymorphobacter sp. TaxID=1909290 RepID=UPI003F6E6623